MIIMSDIFSKKSAKKFLKLNGYIPKGVINVRTNKKTQDITIVWKEKKKNILTIKTNVDIMSKSLYNYNRIQKLNKILNECDG